MLGNVVNSGEEFFVLRLEGDVELKKIGALDIPVCEMGLGHEGVAVGNEGFEGGGDLVLGLGFCSSHGMTLSGELEKANAQKKAGLSLLQYYCNSICRI